MIEFFFRASFTHSVRAGRGFISLHTFLRLRCRKMFDLLHSLPLTLLSLLQADAGCLSVKLSQVFFTLAVVPLNCDDRNKHEEFIHVDVKRDSKALLSVV